MRMPNLGRRRGRGDIRGTAALEFALVAPAFFIIFFGILYASFMAYTMSTMKYAVQEGARCASVKTTVCTNAATTGAYARSQYFGPGAPTFTAVLNTACGNSVSASITQTWNFRFFQSSVPLSASACFPLI